MLVVGCFVGAQGGRNCTKWEKSLGELRRCRRVKEANVERTGRTNMVLEAQFGQFGCECKWGNRSDQQEGALSENACCVGGGSFCKWESVDRPLWH